MTSPRAIDRVKIAMADPESRPDLEPQPEYKRLISWSNPRVWLRELVYAISDWLNKRTEAEIAHREAAYAEFIDWGYRTCGGPFSTDPVPQSQHSEPEQQVPADPERLD